MIDGSCVSLGGLAGGIVTAPFDVVKTRLQSDLFQDAVKASSSKGAHNGMLARTKHLLYHVVETGIILRYVSLPRYAKSMHPDRLECIGTSANTREYLHSFGVLDQPLLAQSLLGQC